MIKLTKGSPPACLDDATVIRLTQKFKDTGDSVWHIEELKEALLNSSFKKCAFCECSIVEESKYIEVEHFKYKDKYPDDVLKWENLLPACRRCNGTKLKHDVELEPIVNPFEDNPAAHFSLRNYRLKPKTDKGRESIEVLDLNNSSRVVMSRFEIGEKINEMLITAFERLQIFKANGRTQSRNRFLRQLTDILAEAQPTAAYAATTATLLHADETYIDLVEETKRLDLWKNDLQQLHVSSLAITLP